MQKSLHYLAFDNLAALCAIVAFASKHIDSLQGTRESLRSIRHMTAAVRAVKELLRNEKSIHENGTVFSVALLATAEVSRLLEP